MPRALEQTQTCCLCLLFFVSCTAKANAPKWPAVPSHEGAAGTAQDDYRAAEAALTVLRAAPTDEGGIIWYGRRLAYLADYELAITVYSRGLTILPDSAKLLRHRGHRYISTRRFDLAVEDFERAAKLIEDTPDEVEPDGKPNAANTPTSTLHTNIWYHLGLARYCRGEFDKALTCYQRCLDAAKNPDMEVATRYWLYLTAIRLGKDQIAAAFAEPVRADWQVIENHAYHDLLLLFRGDKKCEEFAKPKGDAIQSATLAYGLARYDLIRDETQKGQDQLRALAATKSHAFGCIAAEADLSR